MAAPYSKWVLHLVLENAHQRADLGAALSTGCGIGSRMGSSGDRYFAGPCSSNLAVATLGRASRTAFTCYWCVRRSRRRVLARKCPAGMLKEGRLIIEFNPRKSPSHSDHLFNNI